MLRLVLEIENAVSMPDSPAEVVEEYILHPDLRRAGPLQMPVEYAHSATLPDGEPMFRVRIVEAEQKP